jgi:hypothetical protein
MDLSNVIQDVQAAADVVSSGEKEGHAKLLKAIIKLNQAVETPTETLMRISYQVSQSHHFDF